LGLSNELEDLLHVQIEDRSWYCQDLAELWDKAEQELQASSSKQQTERKKC
jgi:hypothetical protein